MLRIKNGTVNIIANIGFQYRIHPYLINTGQKFNSLINMMNKDFSVKISYI